MYMYIDAPTPYDETTYGTGSLQTPFKDKGDRDLHIQVVLARRGSNMTEVVHKQAYSGHYMQVVFVYRWSCTQVVTTCRWFLYTCGFCTQVVTTYRWSLYTGGHYMQVVFVHRWSLHAGGSKQAYSGHNIQVVFVHRWSLHAGGSKQAYSGHYMQVVFAHRWSLHTGYTTMLLSKKTSTGSSNPHPHSI